jgi:hypothetical protein
MINKNIVTVYLLPTRYEDCFNTDLYCDLTDKYEMCYLM